MSTNIAVVTHVELFHREKNEVCANAGCDRLVGDDPWEKSARLCWRCALERDLWDRDARWDHVGKALPGLVVS